MVRKGYPKIRYGSLVLTLLSLILAAGMVAPFLWMFIMSTKTSSEIFSKPLFEPGKNLLRNFLSIMHYNFPQAFLNSMLVSAGTAAASVFVSALAGFAFSKYRFRGKQALFAFVLATLIIPPEIGLVAYVWQIRLMKLSNTLLSLIMPYVASAFGIFWMKQYIDEAVPYELLESARIDGCREFHAFRHIVLPIIKPAVFTLMLVNFMSSWNNYMLPLVAISKVSRYTIPLAVATIGNQYMAEYGAQILGVTLGLLPMLIIFMLSSKVITRSVVAGAIKG